MKSADGSEVALYLSETQRLEEFWTETIKIPLSDDSNRTVHTASIKCPWRPEFSIFIQLPRDAKENEGFLVRISLGQQSTSVHDSHLYLKQEQSFWLSRTKIGGRYEIEWLQERLSNGSPGLPTKLKMPPRIGLRGDQSCPFVSDLMECHAGLGCVLVSLERGDIQYPQGQQQLPQRSQLDVKSDIQSVMAYVGEPPRMKKRGNPVVFEFVNEKDSKPHTNAKAKQSTLSSRCIPVQTQVLMKPIRTFMYAQPSITTTPREKSIKSTTRKITASNRTKLRPGNDVYGLNQMLDNDEDDEEIMPIKKEPGARTIASPVKQSWKQPTKQPARFDQPTHLPPSSSRSSKLPKPQSGASSTGSGSTLDKINAGIKRPFKSSFTQKRFVHDPLQKRWSFSSLNPVNASTLDASLSNSEIGSRSRSSGEGRYNE